jgi:hypothetical protein
MRQCLCGLLGLFVGLVVGYPGLKFVLGLPSYLAGGPFPVSGEARLALVTWTPAWCLIGLLVGLSIGRRQDRKRRLALLNRNDPTAR